MSPEVTKHNNLALCQTGLCVCVGTYMCVCHSCIYHIPQRGPVPLLCSILINPAMTEWTWQVMYVLGLG